MSNGTIMNEVVSALKAVLQETSHGDGMLASAVAMGVAGGAGAVFALEYHGRVGRQAAWRRGR